LSGSHPKAPGSVELIRPTRRPRYIVIVVAQVIERRARFKMVSAFGVSHLRMRCGPDQQKVLDVRARPGAIASLAFESAWPTMAGQFLSGNRRLSGASGSAPQRPGFLCLPPAAAPVVPPTAKDEDKENDDQQGRGVHVALLGSGAPLRAWLWEPEQAPDARRSPACCCCTRLHVRGRWLDLAAMHAARMQPNPARVQRALQHEPRSHLGMGGLNLTPASPLRGATCPS
jgi:hypothetical protein